MDEPGRAGLSGFLSQGSRARCRRARCGTPIAPISRSIPPCCARWCCRRACRRRRSRRCARDRAAQRRPGVRQGGTEVAAVRAALRHRRRSQCAGAPHTGGEARGAEFRDRLHQEPAEIMGSHSGRLDRHAQRATVVAALVPALLATGAEANEPFYKGKRLSVLINYGAGGPADIEGRLFARHYRSAYRWQPNLIVSESATAPAASSASPISARSRPATAPSDGHLTGSRLELRHRSRRLSRRFLELRVRRLSARECRSYYMRTDTPPGMKDGYKSRAARPRLVAGGLVGEFLQGPR